MRGLIFLGLFSLLYGWVVSDGPQLELFPKVVDTGDNTVVVIWEDSRNGSFDIFAQKIDTETGSKLWDNNGVAVSNPRGLDQQGHRLNSTVIGDGSGGVICAWINHAERKVYAQRINSNGEIPYGTNWYANNTKGVPIYTSYDLQTPALCEDGNGGAVFVWVVIDKGEIFNNILKRRMI